jgi:hypothetical protein
MAPPRRPNRRTKHYPDALPDSPTLEPASSSAIVGAADENKAQQCRRSDDYNSQQDHHPPSNEEGEDDKDDQKDWYWQCHLCAYLNTLSPLHKDFNLVPLALSQPCSNTDIPPPEPTYSSRATVPEDGSLEARMRALELEARRREAQDNGDEWKSAYQKLMDAVPPLAGPASSKPPRVSTGSFEVGQGGSAAQVRGAASSSRATAGINDPASALARSIDYAFSIADGSRAGPSKPVRYRGVTGVRAWPGLGAAVPPRTAMGVVRGSEAAGGMDEDVGVQGGLAPATAQPQLPMTAAVLASWTGTGAGASGKCLHRRCEGCYDLDADKRVVRFCSGSEVNPSRYAEWYAGFGFVEGIEPRVVDGGVKRRLREWIRDGDIAEMLLEGEGEGGESFDARRREKERKEALRAELAGVRLTDAVEYGGVNEVGEERIVISGEAVRVTRNETGALEMRRDGPSRSHPRMRSPVRYTTGESRILLVQTAEGSNGDSQGDEATRASSDDGKGIPGERGNDDGDDEEEESSSDGGSHGWIEPITFIHRGSQEGGGCSESGSDDDEGADGDDEMDDEEIDSDGGADVCAGNKEEE